MHEQLSPSYAHEKLNNPTFLDLVDVFEDMWRNYVFDCTEFLLSTPHGQPAALTLLCSYFEAVAGFVTGADTNGASGQYFEKGFSMVFKSADSYNTSVAAKAIYKYVRCGLSHEGMLRHKVLHSLTGTKPFLLTYPKSPDGSLDLNALPASIVVNARLIHDAIVGHFNQYVKDLRSGSDTALCVSFESTAKRQWDISGAENIIGVTEHQFLSGDFGA